MGHFRRFFEVFETLSRWAELLSGTCPDAMGHWTLTKVYGFRIFIFSAWKWSNGHFTLCDNLISLIIRPEDSFHSFSALFWVFTFLVVTLITKTLKIIISNHHVISSDSRVIFPWNFLEFFWENLTEIRVVPKIKNRKILSRDDKNEILSRGDFIILEITNFRFSEF